MNQAVEVAMRLPVKDVFFIHSERAPSEYAVVDRAAQLLVGAGFSVWGYEDWEWEHETEELTYARSGKNLDMRRFAQGDPRPFKKYIQDDEVDTDTLESIFKTTKVVVVVNPTGRPTEGVLDEMQTLRWMARRIVGLRFVLCQINTTEPDPLVTFIDYAGTIQLAFSDEPDDQSLVDLVVLIVTHLLDGVVEYHLSSDVGLVGWNLRTDISRSRRFARRLQEAGFETCAAFTALQHAISKAGVALDSTPTRLPGIGSRLVFSADHHTTQPDTPVTTGVVAGDARGGCAEMGRRGPCALDV